MSCARCRCASTSRETPRTPGSVCERRHETEHRGPRVRTLPAPGVAVVSGLALGVDGAAHAGALAAGGPTVAVLAGGADVPYPASHAHLYRGIATGGGAVVSELPPGTRAFRWCFPARNRIIAALAGATVIVEAAPRSGALVTAAVARELGREVGAVPGRVT